MIRQLLWRRDDTDSISDRKSKAKLPTRRKDNSTMPREPLDTTTCSLCYSANILPAAISDDESDGVPDVIPAKKPTKKAIEEEEVEDAEDGAAEDEDEDDDEEAEE